MINRPDISAEYGFGDCKISVDTADDLALAERIYEENDRNFPIGNGQTDRVDKKGKYSVEDPFVPSVREKNGTGHLKRCLLLAQQLISDNEVMFFLF